MAKKRTNAYWINRSEETLANIHNQTTPYIHDINKYYDKALQDLQIDINKIFQTYANNHKLTTVEARKLLNGTISSREIEHLRKEIAQISNVELKKSLLAQINSNAYKARITRLEALKQSIAVNYTKVADKELQLSKRAYINAINESYYRTAFNLQKGIDIGFNFAQIPTKAVNAILNTNWSGKLYRKRIWGKSQTTINSIAETITSGFINGKSIPRMVKEIEDLTQYGKYAAERLIRTECTYFANMGSVESYKECDVEKYIFVATLDVRTSEECRKHDRKVYEVRKAEPGKNLPPLHVWCRSTTRAYLGEKYMKNIKRRARDPETGKTYLVEDMDYNSWHNKYVKASKDTLNRRTNNVGKFENLTEPMQLKHVKKVAKSANIDLAGIKIKIQRQEDLLDMPFVGSAAPEQIGRIDLFPNAFMDREQLLRTLVHEKVHVEQYKKYGSKYVMENREKFEQEAYKIEEEWYTEYIKKGGQ